MSKGPARAALLCVLALACGCGGDPVRADLEAYERAVLAPLAAEEARVAQELEAPIRAAATDKLDPKATGLLYHGLSRRYVELAQQISAYKPRTKELIDLHARLAGQYRVVAGELEKAGDAYTEADGLKTGIIHERLSHLGIESLRAELTALAKKHGLDVKK